MWLPSGSWSSGAWPQPRPRRHACARRRWRGCSSNTASAGSMPRPPSASCAGPPSRPAITVAAGVTESAVLHLRSLIARLRLANREFHRAERKLDELCAALRETASALQDSGPGDVAILSSLPGSSLPGVGTVTLATLLTEATGPLGRRDHAALRTLSGVALRRGAGDQAQRQDPHRRHAPRRPGPARSEERRV